MSDVLTVKEAAARLKIQPRTVREWLRLGKLPGVKIGKDWRVRVEDLEAVLTPRLQLLAGPVEHINAALDQDAHRP